jgi:hypothetical protein
MAVCKAHGAAFCLLLEAGASPPCPLPFFPLLKLSSLRLCLCAEVAQDSLLLEDVVSLGLSDGLIVDLSGAGA